MHGPKWRGTKRINATLSAVRQYVCDWFGNRFLVSLNGFKRPEMRGKLNTDIRNHGMVEIKFASMFLTCNLKKESVKYLFPIKVKIDQS